MPGITAGIVKKNIVMSVMSLGSKAVSLISGLLASSLILYSSYVLYDTCYIQNAAFATGWDLLQYKPEIIEDGEMPLNEMGLGVLADINEDTAAWLTVYDTHIDYPVLQGENDLYYASHDIYKESSLTGAIYLSCMNEKDFSDSYNMIYGHHMDNGAMFGDIDHFVDADYFNSHREGLLILKDGTIYDLNIFACVSTDAYENAVYSVGNRDLNTVVSYAKAHALQFAEGETNGASQIVVLSTCAAGETNGRLVLYAVMNERAADKPENEPKDAAAVAGPDNGESDPDTPDDVIEDDGVDGTDDGEGYNSGIEADVTDEDAEDSIVPADVFNGGNHNDGLGGLEEIEETEEIIEETEAPLANFVNKFTPAGGSHGTRVWALANLVCLGVTIYLFLPVLHIRDKYSRGRKMRRVNEENSRDFYGEKKFTRRFRLGIVLELADCALALAAFLLTEDMRLPMALIDRWTPLMILLMGICLIVDFRLARYREEEPEAVYIADPAPQPGK